jgi:dipeptidyl aminopeptidase/acylaminoacyl peptidase
MPRMSQPSTQPHRHPATTTLPTHPQTVPRLLKARALTNTPGTARTRLPAPAGQTLSLAAFVLACCLLPALTAPAQPRVYRDRVTPHWSTDGNRFWYRNDLPGGTREFVLVDAAAGQRAPAFDHDRVATALAKLTGAEVTPSRLPVESLAFMPDPAELLLTSTNGTTFRLDLRTSTVERQTTPGASTRPATTRATTQAATDRPRRGRRADRPHTGPRSPDGKWTLSVRNDNLFITPASSDAAAAAAAPAPLPLTSDGRPDDGYALDRVHWSPDSAHVVAIRLQAAQKHPVYTVESSPKDRLEPQLRTIDYLRPGDRIAHPRPMLFRVANRAWIPVADALFPNPWSVQDVRWSSDSSRFTFFYNQRGHQVLRIVSVDAATGSASALVDETSQTFIDYSGKFYCEWLGDDELLWASERHGHNHLYLYDARTGRVKTQVTGGPWVVRAVDRVDPVRRQIYFRAAGIRPGHDPYHTHFCRANLDGSGLTILTEGDGEHTVQWSPDGRYLIDTWSRVDLPPVTELRRASDGAAVCPLETADAREALAARGGRWPLRLTAKGRDGKTDIHGVAWLPRDFDPAKKYPVLENVYAGPQGFFTPKRFSADHGERQRLADLGMIVVQADGMGTNGRGKAFHDVCWKNLKDAGFPDRIAWIRAAAAGPLPQMDLSRVGIYGGSAGGQNAMAALLWHHDFYKVAVADCGCHDNRMDKIWWNEQWMGWPVDKSYEASSNVVNAHLMQGRLMLIVGELDRNVDPSSTFQTAAALQRAGKDFELVVVIGAGHGAAETRFGRQKRTRFIEQHLLGRPN